MDLTPRQAAKYGVLGLVGLFAIPGLIAQATKAKAAEPVVAAPTLKKAPPAPAFTKEEILSAVTAATADVKEFQVGDISIEDLDARTVRLKYKSRPDAAPLTLRSAEFIERVLVKQTIDLLLKKGIDPHAGRMSISARAYEPAGKTVTGHDAARTFGSARYDYNADAIVFDPK